MKHMRFLAAACTIGVFTAVTACGGDNTEEGEGGPIEIVYTHSSAPTISFALFECVASEAGFWRDEGLDVTVETIDGGTAAMQSLQSGQSDIVDTGTSVVLPANQAGSDTPSFHTLVTGPFVYPAVLEDSDIENMRQLEGRRIGVLSLASGGIPYIKSLVASDGGDPERVEFIPVGAGAPAVAALQNGEIDALGFADTAYALIESRGTPLRFIRNDAVERTGFGVTYSARRDWLTENRDAAAGFARAAARAYVFARENPEAAVRMCWDIYPELLPANADEDTALTESVAALEARLGSSGPVDGRIGFATEEQIQEVIDLQVAAEVIEPGLTPADVWTDEVNEAANQFDQAQVEEFARSYGQ